MTFYVDSVYVSNQIGAPVTLNGTNTATVGTSSLTVSNNHTIIAVYSGDGVNFNSGSGQLSPYVVAAASTQAVVTAAPATSSIFGQPITFTATVAMQTPSLAAPPSGGNVTFFDGTTPLGVPQNLQSGSLARLVLPAGLAVSAHTIRAVYSGDSPNYLGCNGQLVYTVGQAPTQAIITALPASNAVFGQPITFTTTISALNPSLAAPPTGGSVTFFDGTTQLGGTQNLQSGGLATLVIPAGLSVTSHTIRAVYSGDSANYLGCNGQLVYAVGKANTNTNVSASPSSSIFGQTVTFSATIVAVSPGVGIPTGGSVTFYDNYLQGTTQITTSIGSKVVSGGTAYITTAALLGGVVHTVSAVYSGDNLNFNGSTGTLNSFTVAGTASVTTVTASLMSPNNPVYGQAVSFTATVAAAPANAGLGLPNGGTITFYDNWSVQIGSAVNVSNGKAVSIPINTLTVGTHTITANYSGGAAFAASTGVLVNYVVVKADTKITVSGPIGIPLHQMTNFTVSVGSLAPSAAPVMNGSVTYHIGSTTGTVTLVNGHAMIFTPAFNVPGTYPISATYSGSTNFNQSSGGTQLGVGLAPTETYISMTPGTARYGEPFTISATVTSPTTSSDPTTGSVTFYDGTQVLGNQPVDDTSTASLFLANPTLSAGTHTIRAVYSGDSVTYLPSPFASSSYDIIQAGTSTAVTASQAGSVFGQFITFTATVTANSPSVSVPSSGSVWFYDGNIFIGVAQSINASGIATFATNSLSVASHTISATYLGNANWSASTGVLAFPFTVNTTATTTTVTSTSNPADVDEPVILTATVTAQSPSVGTPTGSVAFYNGSNPIGQPALITGGVATFSTTALPLGTFNITAKYIGDGNYLTSTSPNYPFTLVFVNDVPSFTKGANQAPLEDSGLNTVANWAKRPFCGRYERRGPGAQFHRQQYQYRTVRHPAGHQSHRHIDVYPQTGHTRHGDGFRPDPRQWRHGQRRHGHVRRPIFHDLRHSCQ